MSPKICLATLMWVGIPLAVQIASTDVSGVISPTTKPAVKTLAATDFPLDFGGATARATEFLKPFDRTETFHFTLERVAKEDSLQGYLVKYPSPFASPWPENNVVPGELYLPKNLRGKTSAVIVLDIMDGSAFVARGMARYFAEQGLIGLYVPMSCYGPRRPAGNAHIKAFMADPTLTVQNMRQTVMDIRRAKALLASLPGVDPDRISITGTSLGGIMTSLAAGVDGHFYRVVPILAGGDLATLVFHAREARQMRLAAEAHGLTRDDLAQMLEPVEPLTFASRIAPESCLMINARMDEVIPPSTTERLNKAIGGPQILWTPVGHYSTALYLPNIRQKALEFIKGKSVTSLKL